MQNDSNAESSPDLSICIKWLHVIKSLYDILFDGY